MAVEEISQSIKATLYERAKKPFSGAFILTWLAYNWKIFAILFFMDEKLMLGYTKIGYVEYLKLLNWNNLIWYPFKAAIIGIIALGILNMIATTINLIYNNLQFEYIEKKKYVTPEEYGKLLDKLKKNNNQWDSYFESLTDEIKTLKELNLDLDKINKKLQIDKTGLSTEISMLKSTISNLEDIKRDSRKKYDTLLSINETYREYLYDSFEIIYSYQLEYGLIRKDTEAIKNSGQNPRSNGIEGILKNIKEAHDHYLPIPF
ncbi:hypothetical protein [uncultured Tenacibaculum sp.]|uniref:hypothetical protein n=1 Tax=uncultured Tenacibaculum sp. TaxID=174713 RepID=UPI00260E5B38|nr:hypothetical protein [uncultured Tenacibaculum sp.]